MRANGRLLRGGGLVAVFCAACAGLGPRATQAAPYYVTVAGLGGDPDYEQRFTALAKDLDKLFKAPAMWTKTKPSARSKHFNMPTARRPRSTNRKSAWRRSMPSSKIPARRKPFALLQRRTEKGCWPQILFSCGSARRKRRRTIRP